MFKEEEIFLMRNHIVVTLHVFYFLRIFSLYVWFVSILLMKPLLLQVSDGDHIDRLISCLHMALPFFVVQAVFAIVLLNLTDYMIVWCLIFYYIYILFSDGCIKQQVCQLFEQAYLTSFWQGILYYCLRSANYLFGDLR